LGKWGRKGGIECKNRWIGFIKALPKWRWIDDEDEEQKDKKKKNDLHRQIRVKS